MKAKHQTGGNKMKIVVSNSNIANTVRQEEVESPRNVKTLVILIENPLIWLPGKEVQVFLMV